MRIQRWAGLGPDPRHSRCSPNDHSTNCKPVINESHNYVPRMSFDLSEGAKSIIEDLGF